MSLNSQIITKLKKHGAEFVQFVDVLNLPKKQTKSFQSAIIIGISLSIRYLLEITKNSDYVETMIRKNTIEKNEFHQKEIFTDRLADRLAEYLTDLGYAAYSQSEKNLMETGSYNQKEIRSPLPHKTIAGLAGLGWIGKHNLLVSPEYGSAISMCTVLTNALVNTILFNPVKSKCGNCNICGNVCSVNVIIR